MLTKSKYLDGEQCHLKLWLKDRKLLPEPSLADLHRFKQGYNFQDQVYFLFPEGVDLGELEFKENLEKTKELVKEKKIIFEAGFSFEDLYLRADIIEPNGKEWDLYEIKATSQVKKHHIPDLAFQKYVLEKAGLKINKCFVLFLNKEYEKNGKIDPSALVSKEDVTAKVNLVKNIEDNAKVFMEVMARKERPPMPISKNCNKPNTCPNKPICWGTLPQYNVLQLTNWRQYWPLFHEGVVAMKDIPEDVVLKPKDMIIRKAAVENRVIVSKEHIKHFLCSLQYPLYHFDFETFDTAVPIYDKSRPYQKIPFQYSLHIEHEDGKLEHYEYLASGDVDPRMALLEQLQNEIKGVGSVVVYHKVFERDRLKELASDFPEHAEWIQKVLDRLVDLEDPFKAFYYCNPSQKGSYSIKKVLPAITGKGYDGMEVSNGADASAQYFNAYIKDSLNDDKLRKALLEYCGLDTEAMVWIVKELKKLI